MKFANYQNLRAKRNKKVIKVKAPSRFSKRNMFQRVKAGNKRRPRTPSSSNSNKPRRRLVKKNYPMMRVPSVYRHLGSIPTRAGVPFHRTGTQSPETKRKINAAHAERMRKYANLVRPGMTAAKKSALSNRLLQNAIKNVMGNSNSNANVPTNRAKNVKARIMKKLRAMERRKLPKVNLAKTFASGIMSGRQQVNAVAARRPTKNERTALNNLRKKYAAMMGGGNKNSNSSSNSNRNNSPPKAKAAPKKKAATGAMKSIRRP